MPVAPWEQWSSQNWTIILVFLYSEMSLATLWLLLKATKIRDTA